MKARLNRDEQGFSKIPENYSRPRHQNFAASVGRQPSDLIQDQIEHPMMNLQNFKPALDEFLRNGPSSDVEKLKNLAVEIAAMNSRLDPSQLSTEIDHNFGLQSNQSQASQLGPQNFSLSRENVGFSVNSFSSLVDFGDLDTNKSRRESSWQQSVNELMPASGDAEKYHKEYKVYESNDAKRLTSKDWTINYSMNSQTFTPMNEASSELTNNVVTYVQLNEMDEDDYMQAPRMARMTARPMYLPDDKRHMSERQMSVDIKTASIGIDNEGRLGSYELISTNLQMQQSPHAVQGNDQWDPVPLPPDGYRVEPSPDHPGNYEHHTYGANNHHQRNSGDYRQQTNDAVYHTFGQPAFNSFPVSYELHHHQQQQQQQMPQSHGPIRSQTQDKNVAESYQPERHSLPGDAGVILPYEITQGDVLLERGGKGNHHKGSRYYRRLINERRESYQELPDSSRAEKMAISLSVVMSVKATGARFIHKKKGKYVIMSDREARNKISQALREKKERVMLDA